MLKKKIRTLLSKELTRLKKNIRNSESVKKSATEKSKKLEEKLSEREKEISALKEKVTSFKTALNTQQQALQTEAPPPEPDTASESFPSSDVIEKLTSAIKEGIKKDLDTFKKSDALLDKMQNKLSKKEEQLLAGMEKLAEKEDELVKENLRQKEALEAAFQKDREEYEEQVSELRRKTESISEENEKLLDAQMGIQNDFDLQKKEEQQREVEAQEKLGEDRKKINQRIKELLKEEQKFFKEREFARKGFVSKEENIQKMAADQMLQGMKINEARRALETEKQEFKEELQKKFDDAVASLKADFDIQKDLLTKEKTALFHRRQEQDEAWTKLKAKEKELKKTIQERVKQETEKRKAELDQREKELEERVDKIIKEEQLLQQDKKNIVEKLSAGLGGKTSLLKLQGLIKNQEALMARKHKLLESEESFRKRVY
ncbi:MAG: hypothetical protein ACE5FU_10930, partial [Nitrospinota bacterium]